VYLGGRGNPEHEAKAEYNGRNICLGSSRHFWARRLRLIVQATVHCASDAE